ncbi:uncharacterized protein SRS1_21011 [Sporisorium reilianum f. sp. reilianum]|uniref:Uncharacterized protein n=1 Tax=Sporisorium reilianum f. sp. reilianum TaxID=72559 RepID=A0A2N8UBU4_9BASI|nr:uncharacterized protein SRS1_21011 [Sporisorium reilianum f. sp. reilianum]
MAKRPLKGITSGESKRRKTAALAAELGRTMPLPPNIGMPLQNTATSPAGPTIKKAVNKSIVSAPVADAARPSSRTIRSTASTPKKRTGHPLDNKTSSDAQALVTKDDDVGESVLATVRDEAFHNTSKLEDDSDAQADS